MTVALQHGVGPVLGQVGEEVLDHRVGAATVGAEEQREHVALGYAGGRGAQRLTGARPVHAPQARGLVGRREAVDRQRQGPVGRHELMHAGVEGHVVDHVRLADDQHDRTTVRARPRQRAPADVAQTRLEPPLGIQGRGIGGLERRRLERVPSRGPRQRAHGPPEGAPHPWRLEPVALLLEEDRAQDPGPRALGVQRAPHHVRRALGHRARVRLRAGVGQRQVDEDRRQQDIHRCVGEAVQQLHRGARPWSRAPSVALGERSPLGAQHLDPAVETAQQRMEERQRVDEIVRQGEPHRETGGGRVSSAGAGAGPASSHAGRRRPPRAPSREASRAPDTRWAHPWAASPPPRRPRRTWGTDRR